jgi:ABC-type nitrate/sulfonate/bicarbonate transport system permease component
MFLGIGNAGGLGRKIYDCQFAWRIPETYAAIVATGLLGIMLNQIVRFSERYMLRWLPKLHEEQ